MKMKTENIKISGLMLKWYLEKNYNLNIFAKKSKNFKLMTFVLILEKKSK